MFLQFIVTAAFYVLAVHKKLKHVWTSQQTPATGKS